MLTSLSPTGMLKWAFTIVASRIYLTNSIAPRFNLMNKLRPSLTACQTTLDMFNPVGWISNSFTTFCLVAILSIDSSTSDYRQLHTKQDFMDENITLNIAFILLFTCQNLISTFISFRLILQVSLWYLHDFTSTLLCTFFHRDSPSRQRMGSVKIRMRSVSRSWESLTLKYITGLSAELNCISILKNHSMISRWYLDVPFRCTIGLNNNTIHRTHTENIEITLHFHRLRISSVWLHREPSPLEQRNLDLWPWDWPFV